MKEIQGGFFLLFFFFVSLLVETEWCSCLGEESYGPSYFIDCGGASQNLTLGGRFWQTDMDSGYLLSSLDVGEAAMVASPPPSGSVPEDDPLYGVLNTARFFPSYSAYAFPVLPGSHTCLRFHFCPLGFAGRDPAQAVFSVVVDSFVLLSDISVSGSSLSSGCVVKEYVVYAAKATLSVAFVPASQTMKSAYAFVNAIELLTLPDNMVKEDSSSVGPYAPVLLGIPSVALETIHRTNIGGLPIPSANDTFGRTWRANDSVTGNATSISTPIYNIEYGPETPSYFAPESVYSTAVHAVSSLTNLSWSFPVSPSFSIYMVRLHFCEIQDGIAAKQRLFNVYLQNRTAFASLDVYAQANGTGVPYYHDFTVNTSGATTLRIQIGPVATSTTPTPTPTSNPNTNNAILNGVEIFKLNNSHGSLDGTVTVSSILPQSGSKVGAPIIAGITVAAALLGIAGFVLFFCLRRSKQTRRSRSGAVSNQQPSPAWLPLPIHAGNSVSIGSNSSSAKSGGGNYISSASSSLGRRHFNFAEIREATENFDESLIIGVGGFGKVYSGVLDDGTKVAIKRGNPSSEQGIREFQTEIEMLSKVRHRHLVSLIGYCEEHSEMILVYEYMANGPLRSHLYGSDLPSLSWKQRLNICIGAARGLHYLHTGAAQGIIHRDVKTTNILLDENLVAKVADFGLCKTGPALDHTHVSTAVKGSFGYLDPEYFRRQKLTEKSDVYSFGVVLIEVLCVRPVINPSLPRDQVNIVEWAMRYQNAGLLERIVDPRLAGTIRKESLKKFGETAKKCLADQGIHRPTMGDVLWNLEYALQLQETAVSSHSTDEVNQVPTHIPLHQHQQQDQWDMTNTTSSMWSEEGGSEYASPSMIFSQLVKAQGR